MIMSCKFAQDGKILSLLLLPFYQLHLIMTQSILRKYARSTFAYINQNMNKIIIAQNRPDPIDNKTYFIEFADANNMLTILRSDYFENCTLSLPDAVTNAKLRFLMHFGRLLTSKGKINVEGKKESLDKTKTILKNMGLSLINESEGNVEFAKKIVQEEKKEEKLAIGFKTQAEEAIDEDELLKNEKIDLEKKQGTGCGDKSRACANCNCGRKKNQPLPSKQELVKSVNEGKMVSGCGKCFLGDSSRCATCPYQGMPAFNPGDKLILVDESNIVVEKANTVVESGKVKIEI